MNYKGLGIRLRNIVNDGMVRSFGAKEEWAIGRNTVNPKDGRTYDYQVDCGKRLWDDREKDMHYLWRESYQSGRQVAEEIRE